MKYLTAQIAGNKMAPARKCCLFFAPGRCGTAYLTFLLRVLGREGQAIFHEEVENKSLLHLQGAWGTVLVGSRSAYYASRLHELHGHKDIGLQFVVLARDLISSIQSWLKHLNGRRVGSRAVLLRWGATVPSPIAFDKRWTMCQMIAWRWFSAYAAAYKLRNMTGDWRFFRFADLNSVKEINGLLHWLGGFAPADAAILQRVQAKARNVTKPVGSVPGVKKAELRAWLPTLSKADRQLVMQTSDWLVWNGVVRQHPRQVLKG